MTIVKLDTYSDATGAVLSWDPGYGLNVATHGNEVILSGNSAGLRSLARHLLTLAGEEVPTGYHIHFEPSLELDDMSASLVLEKNA